MINIRHKYERGETQTAWLDSKHSFSFGGYHDAKNMGFGPLRVINEDIVIPGAGFHTHGHANMEIITYVMSGALEHKDSLGNGDVIRPGDIQLMSAGKGILHSEFNPSETEEVHLLQIWIMPDVTGTKPGYQQTRFDPAEFKNRLRLIVSPDGAEGSLTIRQDARIFVTHADAGHKTDLQTQSGRKYWVQVAKGAIETGGKTLAAGDGLALENEASLTVMTALENAELLVFDLPR